MMAMSSEENKALSRRLLEEVWNQKNLSAADEIIGPEHNPQPYPEDEPDFGRGPEGTKRFVGAYLNAFPDAHYTIHHQIAEGDMVVTHWTARGTHQGELFGIPPTGKQVTVTGINIDRISDGKIAESWVSYDRLGFLRQLGVIPEAGQMSREASMGEM